MNDPLAILENQVKTMMMDDNDHQQYDDLYQGVVNLEEAKANVLGGEVALWTEQADGFSMMTRS